MDRMWSDRRRYARFLQKVPACLQFRKDGAILQTYTRDVAVEGAEFCWVRNVEAGERLVIQLRLPTGTIRCEAIVRWVKALTNGQWFFGIRFMNMIEETHRQLEHFLGKVEMGP